MLRSAWVILALVPSLGQASIPRKLLPSGKPFATMPNPRGPDESDDADAASTATDRSAPDESAHVATGARAPTEPAPAPSSRENPRAKSKAVGQARYAEGLERPLAERLQIYKALGNAGSRYLEAAVHDTKLTMQARWRAVTTMGRLDYARHQPTLTAALRSPEWFIRNAALIALLNADRELAVERSRRSLKDPALVVRTQAVRNLIALDARASAPELWRELDASYNFAGKQSLWIRGHIAEALATFARPGQTRQFANLLRDRDRRVHRWAIEGLEVSSGVKLSAKGEPVERQRQKWLTRLDAQAI